MKTPVKALLVAVAAVVVVAWLTYRHLTEQGYAFSSPPGPWQFRVETVRCYDTNYGPFVRYWCGPVVIVSPVPAGCEY